MSAVSLDEVRVIAVDESQQINDRPPTDRMEMAAEGRGATDNLPGHIFETEVSGGEQGFHMRYLIVHIAYVITKH
jgi:hypothetical protein